MHEGLPAEDVSPTPILENIAQASFEENLDITPTTALAIEVNIPLMQSEVDEQIQTISGNLEVSVIPEVITINESPVAIEHEPIDQEQELDLRSQLLSGISSPEQFLASIFSADQGDEIRSSAERNLSLLNDSEIAARLQNDPEYRDEYQNARSLSAFHVAQQRLASGDISGATPFLEIANSAATNVAWENYDGWQKYIKATIAYTKGDVAELSRISDELPAGDSYKEVLERLKSGLNGGSIDYAGDYGGSR